MFERKVIPAVPIPFDSRGRIDQDAATSAQIMRAPLFSMVRPRRVVA